jgi:hypothetical protein
MTKKYYEAMATEFGYEMHHKPAEAEYGLWCGVEAFMRVAKTDNPRFDKDKFKLWVEEVRDGVRNVYGRKESK